MKKIYRKLYAGKNSQWDKEVIKQEWLKLTRELERLEPCDFNQVKN